MVLQNSYINFICITVGCLLLSIFISDFSCAMELFIYFPFVGDFAEFRKKKYIHTFESFTWLIMYKLLHVYIFPAVSC